MAFEIVEYTPDYVRARCDACGMDVMCRVKAGKARIQAVRQLRDERGCNCSIEEGGYIYFRRGMKVFRKSDGEPCLVFDANLVDGTVRVVTRTGNVSRWEHSYKYSRQAFKLGDSPRIVVPR